METANLPGNLSLFCLRKLCKNRDSLSVTQWKRGANYTSDQSSITEHFFVERTRGVRNEADFSVVAIIARGGWYFRLRLLLRQSTNASLSSQDMGIVLV